MQDFEASVIDKRPTRKPDRGIFPIDLLCDRGSVAVFLRDDVLISSLLTIGFGFA